MLRWQGLISTVPQNGECQLVLTSSLLSCSHWRLYRGLPGCWQITPGIAHPCIYHIISHHITAFVLHMALLTSHVPTMYSFETHGRWFGQFFCLEEPLRLMVDAWISKGFEENYANLYEAWWKWPRALAADFEPIIVYAMNGHRSSVGSIHIIMEYNQWYIHIYI